MSIRLFFMRRSRRALIASVLGFAILVTGVALAPAYAVPSYPTWAEVDEARKNVAKKKALIEKLEKIIEELEVEADRLGDEALIKGEIFNQAQDEVDAITVKVNSLQQQADEATNQAALAKQQLGQIAAQMYRDGSGGTALNLFLNSGEADDLLYQLGAQEKLAQQNDVIYQRSVEKQQYAEAVTAELSDAKADLDAKAAVAKKAFKEAKAAAAAVQAKVDENEALNRTMFSQLARLRNTAADLERQRAEGLAAERRQSAGTSAPIAPELYDVGPPDERKVNIAIDFAREQIGERYVLGGMGPNVWDCSGITKAAYAAAGIYLGTHSATNQFRTAAARKQLIPLSQIQPGDLIWWSREAAFDGDKYHVAIALGGGMMLEAPNPARTVRIVPIRWGEMFRYAGRPSA